MFDKNGTSNIAMGYMDFNYVEDLDSTMSMIGHVFTFGGDYICWKSNWHNIVAPCTTQAKYMAMIKVLNEGIWLMDMLEKLGFKQQCVPLLCDSQSAIHLAIKFFMLL